MRTLLFTVMAVSLTACYAPDRDQVRYSNGAVVAPTGYVVAPASPTGAVVVQHDGEVVVPVSPVYPTGYVVAPVVVEQPDVYVHRDVMDPRQNYQPYNSCPPSAAKNGRC